MWKTLTIITILLAGAGAAFRYLNSDAAKLEKEVLSRSEANLEVVTALNDDMDTAISSAKETADTTQGEADGEMAKLETAKTQLGDKESMKTTIEGQIAEKTAKLDALNASIAEVGDIADLVAKSDAISLETATVSQELVTATEKFKSLIVAKANTEKKITTLKERETMIAEGKMSDLSARVSQNFGDWGFVVISAGAAQGVNARALLDVKRGGEVIAKLQVTNLETNVAVCDVLTAGAAQSISVGDSVVVAEESKWDPAKSAAAAAGGAAPAGGEAPAPAPAPAPAGSDDPFGLEAPGTDPAPAGDDDPFGLGTETPEAPAAEADDPFGLN